MRYEVRALDDVEPFRRQLIEFWASSLVVKELPPARLERRFDWLYHENPCGPSITVVAFTEDGSIVGCGSLYSWPCLLHGRPLPMRVAVDFAVARNHRAFGPAFAIQKRLKERLLSQGLDMSFVYPNKASIGPFKGAGYEHIGTSRNWVRILNVGECVRERVALPGLAALLSSSGRIVEHGVNMWLRRAGSRFLPAVVDRCDARFDDLWQRKQAHSRFLFDRSSAFLNWRFADCPTVDYRFFTVTPREAAGMIEGCVVFARDGSSAIIKDVFPATPDTAGPLLALFLDQMARDGAERVSLSFWGDPAFRRLLRRALFFERPTSRDYYLLSSERMEDLRRALVLDGSNLAMFFG